MEEYPSMKEPICSCLGTVSNLVETKTWWDEPQECWNEISIRERERERKGGRREYRGHTVHKIYSGPKFAPNKGNKRKYTY